MKLAVSPTHPHRAISACDLCGTRFLSWINQDRRYCSQLCYNQARRLESHVTRPCEQCGEPFEAVAHRKQRFCSRACSALARRTRITVLCQQCGAAFVSQPSDKAHYCSLACKGRAERILSRSSAPDISGQRFGRLVVVERRGTRKKKALWLCRCDCGETMTASGVMLRCGHIKSCGCLHRDNASRLGKQHRVGHLTHGGSRRPEYGTWKDMRTRCNNPASQDYRHYGGRGITVCERWNDFAAFLEDMGPRPGPQYTIERRDVNQGYEKANCLWIENKYQSRNKRDNRLLTFNGKTQLLSDWAREIGISRSGLSNRLNRLGLSVEEALTLPVLRHRGGYVRYRKWP